MPLDPAQERALIQRAQAGQLEAFDTLVRHTAGSVRNVVVHHGVRPEDIDDVLQEVFLRAWRGLKGFQSKASFTTWLFRITFTVVVDRQRKKRRRPQVVDPFEPDLGERDEAEERYLDTRRNPEETALGHDQVWMVRQALAEVDPVFRQILILREMENCSYQEIAESLGIAEGTVKSRLARARAQLKTVLETKFHW